MAGTWTAVPLAPFSLNATPTSGTFNVGAPSNWGYASSGTSTLAIPTAWGTPSGANAVAVPNASGTVFLWWYCGITAAGVAQVLVGEQVTGAVLPATTAITIAASSSGWIGPLSPATYNTQQPTNVPASSVVSPGPMPAAYAGCYVVEFTLCTTLLVAAYSFGAVQP